MSNFSTKDTQKNVGDVRSEGEIIIQHQIDECRTVTTFTGIPKLEMISSRDKLNNRKYSLFDYEYYHIISVLVPGYVIKTTLILRTRNVDLNVIKTMNMLMSLSKFDKRDIITRSNQFIERYNSIIGTEKPMSSSFLGNTNRYHENVQNTSNHPPVIPTPGSNAKANQSLINTMKESYFYSKPSIFEREVERPSDVKEASLSTVATSNNNVRNSNLRILGERCFTDAGITESETLAGMCALIAIEYSKGHLDNIDEGVDATFKSMTEYFEQNKRNERTHISKVTTNLSNLISEITKLKQDQYELRQVLSEYTSAEKQTNHDAFNDQQNIRKSVVYKESQVYSEPKVQMTRAIDVISDENPVGIGIDDAISEKTKSVSSKSGISENSPSEYNFNHALRHVNLRKTSNNISIASFGFDKCLLVVCNSASITQDDIDKCNLSEKIELRSGIDQFVKTLSKIHENKNDYTLNDARQLENVDITKGKLNEDKSRDYIIKVFKSYDVKVRHDINT